MGNPKLFIVTYYVSTGVLLTPIGQPSGPHFYGSPNPQQLLLSLLPSPLHGSPLTPSLGNLNPTQVSSAQILAVGIFIYQSEPTGGSPSVSCEVMWTLEYK